ncbi:MAG TPA: hypothetical protein VJO15_01285, partial [Dehalococcoidia bacterium]|nr:hypothetical protein [Dehalococcoidia bacterium]
PAPSPWEVTQGLLYAVLRVAGPVLDSRPSTLPRPFPWEATQGLPYAVLRVAGPVLDSRPSTLDSNLDPEP